MKIQILKPTFIAGELHEPGGKPVSLADKVALELIAANKAARFTGKETTSGTKPPAKD